MNFSDFLDIKIIRYMDYLYKRGYFSKDEIREIRILKADNEEIAEINRRLNDLEESNKILFKQIDKLSVKY